MAFDRFEEHRVAATVYFCSMLTTMTGRALSVEVANKSPEFFSSGTPQLSDTGLLAALADIADTLATGEGPISKLELRDAVESYYATSGTPFCPPVIAALA